MAENDPQQAERTEQPTPKRLEDARRRGQIPRSRELSMTAVMLGGAACFLMFQSFFAHRLRELLELGLRIEREQTIDPQVLPRLLGAGLAKAIELLAPLWVVVIVAALIGTLGLGGWAFSVEGLKPKLQKLNPVTGLKRVFGWTGLAELAKALGKFVLVGIVGGMLLWNLAEDFLGLGRLTLQAGLARAAALTALSFAGLSSALVLIAAADVPFQWWQHRRRLRMTKQELKDEQKETEGKPELRSRIRAAQQEIATRRMMQEVPNADVVATNPTHFAVALSYDAKTMKAPRVIAKGADLIALNIREIARANGVPLFEHPALAQALFHTTELGEEIPSRLYVAVAQVLTYVYQLRAVRKDRAASRARKPALEIDPQLLSDPRRARRLIKQGLEG